MDSKFKEDLIKETLVNIKLLSDNLDPVDAESIVRIHVEGTSVEVNKLFS